MKKLKRFLFVVVLLLTAVFVYVEIVNIHSINMTFRQKLLKAIYPLVMWGSKKSTTAQNADGAAIPPVSFYSLNTKMNNGKDLNFETLKGKKVLLVNTASNCGYTAQYEDLQKLYEQYNSKLVIIGFPANDFKEQEKGDDEAIASFCKINYGVSFPLASKSSVIKSADQNPVYQWLTNKAKNGWNEKAPSWNFSKYLVDENGVLLDYFEPGVSPLSDEIVNAVK
jgi:glutathione peroxidase